MPDINRQWLLQRRPRGMVSQADFEYRESPLPVPDLDSGEILVKTLYLSFDPAMRGWMDDVPSYLPPVPLGQPMRASSVAQVIRSRNPDFPEGCLVLGMWGWQEYAVAGGAGDMMPPRRLPEGVPPTMMLGVLGATSLTAYFGLLHVGRPKAGDTVLVSGAAGATGSVVAQIARLKGCRVVGIAGGAEKCRWLREDCRVDDVIDYKHEDVGKRVRELCPQGVNVFFDNVGGHILRDCLDAMADHGVVVMCGQIADYNAVRASAPLDNTFLIIKRRLRLEGFIVIDYLAQAEAAITELAGWIQAGEIRWQEDIQEGFDRIPATLLRLFSGDNRGKQMLKVADPA